MAIDGGVQFTGFISPTSEDDTFPVTKPKYGLGGLRTVASIGERNAIFSARREEGMIVYVEEDETYYSLIGGVEDEDWVQLYVTQNSTLEVRGPGGNVQNVGTINFLQGTNMTIDIGEQDTGTAGVTFSVINIQAGTF
jgi:hypothetical protein